MLTGIYVSVDINENVSSNIPSHASKDHVLDNQGGPLLDLYTSSDR